MVACSTLNDGFLLLYRSPFPSSARGRVCSASCRGLEYISLCISPSFVKDRSVAGVIPLTICADGKLQRISRRVVRGVKESEAAPQILESALQEIDLGSDSISGDGFESIGPGGQGGGGGGGGGGKDGKGDSNNSSDNDNDGDEGSNQNDKKRKKMALSMSQKLTLSYAALVGVGGVIGYMKSGSQKSLAAGGLSALLLYYVYTELPVKPAFASSLGLGLSAVLFGVMISRFKKSRKIFPAGVVSFVSLVMSGGYLHGILRSLRG